MDGTRVQDGLQVMFKKVLPEEGPYELSISRLFSSEELVGDRRNHCVTLLDVIELEGPKPQRLMVFPLLRPFDRPHFQTFGEFVAFFTQLCEVARICLLCVMLIINDWSSRASGLCMRGMWLIGINHFIFPGVDSSLTTYRATAL